MTAVNRPTVLLHDSPSSACFRELIEPRMDVKIKLQLHLKNNNNVRDIQSMSCQCSAVILCIAIYIYIVLLCNADEPVGDDTDEGQQLPSIDSE